MIKDNQKAFHRLHIIIDGLLMAGSYLFAYLLRFDLLTIFSPFALAEGEGYYPLSVYASYLIYLLPGLLILYSACGLYRPKRGRSRRLELWNILRANFFGLFYFTFILNFIKRELDFSRGFMLLFFCINIAASLLFRYSLDNVLRAARRRGFNLKHVLIVGYSRAAERYIDRIRSNPQWGYYVFGILDDEMEKGTQYRKIPVIGSTDELERLIAENNFDEIAITLCMSEYDRLEQIAAICEKSGIHTKFIPDYRNIIPTIPCIEDLDGLPVINIRNVPLAQLGNRIVKRAFDLVGSVFCILLFSIPMLLVAGLIKLTSPGPVIFKQTRVGLHNKEFRMYKFRSMTVQSERTEARAWTTSHDARVTGIGKLIRRTSIDELPQLFNVLIGNMSLVGPRPERPFFVEKFKEEIPRYMIKHQVRPGMTGWAQVNGYRGDTSITKRIECDLYYIENWTLGLDVKILFLTLFKGFINRNAY